MDIITVITIAAIVFANIGTTIGLFIWATTHASDATQNHRADTNAVLKAISDEMKDFHSRLIEIEIKKKL